MQTIGGAPISGAAIVGRMVIGIGGLVLVNLGIVGAYLGRAAREAKERPMYFVAESTEVRSTNVGSTDVQKNVRRLML